MDTKTPPIPLKPQERISQPRKTERVADVSLPPLTPYSSTNRPKNGAPDTSQNLSYPLQHHHHHHRHRHHHHYHHHHQDYRKGRPYRVLHIGATPLMHACQQGDRARVLKLLKEQEETISYRDRTLRNALHYCMEAGTGGAVAAAAPELVNAPDAEGHTPLHLAVIAGDTQLVAVLLANGADVNAKDLEGHSVLHWATVCGETECVRLILAAGAQPSAPDLRGGSPLHYAAQCCGAAATAELAVPKKIGLKVLQTLLDFGADVNAKDEDGRQPILWAASAGSVEAVLALARAGGSAAAGTSDKDGLTALHCAASRGHARCVEALVNLCGSQPDHVDDNGCSALHYAATLGHADATALILKLGADPNRQDRKGRTPALCAAAKGQLETLKILTQHGGSFHVRTVRGTGIGHEAVASGRIELIKWLAKRRPSTLDVVTHDGKTPLHVAALHGHLDVCKVLLDHGARINAVLRTNRGNTMTPLDAALYRGHRDCAKLIQMHGGTTAQQLRLRNAAPNKVFTAKVRVKHAGSSTASDSSPCEQSQRHPELYYEERWIERRTRRESNLRKLARRDSRSFSEEEVRSSRDKTSSRKDERRARSESARYDANGFNERNLRRKRNRGGGGGSRTHRRKYLNSSDESSDSCRYSHDENEASVRRHRARKRQEKNKGSNEAAEAGIDRPEDNLIEEDERSVSDDSLEVIVVKKSLEKKCEKVVSGSRSKTPRECTKETKLTKMHKCSSKRISRSSRSEKISDNEDAAHRAQFSPHKKGESAKVESSTKHSDDGNTAKYQGDAVTDSTSQETVERVVVTAMIHKDQMPDTPKSIFEATKETDGTVRDVDSTLNESIKMASHKIDTVASEGRSQRKARQESSSSQEIQNDKIEPIDAVSDGEQEKGKNNETQNRLRNVKPKKDTLREDQETANKTFDGSSDLDVNASGSTCAQVFVGENKKSAKNQEETDGKSVILEDRKDPLGNFTTINYASVDTENGKKLLASQVTLRSDKDSERATKKTASDNEESVTCPPSRRSSVDKNQAASVTKDNEAEASELAETRAKAIDKASPFKAARSWEEENKTQDAEAAERSNDGTDLDDSARGKSADLSSTGSRTSMLDVRKSLSADKERAEIETGDKDFRYMDDSCSSSSKAEPTKPRHSRPLTGRNARTRGKSADARTASMTTRHLFVSSEERSPYRSAIVAVIDSPEWDEDEAIEKEIRQVFGEETEHDTEQEDNGAVRVLPSTSEEETPSTAMGTSRTSRIDSLPQVVRSTNNRFLTIMDSEPDYRERSWRKQRRDSGGKDSGIEPSPRVSKIPRRRNVRCCPNTTRQQALNMETVTRDVQISLRRYHLERKIFFQLMELKRLQIRHGRTNEHVLVKRQVEAFHRSGMSGPTLGVARYDRQLTFREFEAFLYEQLRRLQGRPTTPDFCTEAKQCTRKTHHCHHATSAYTSVPAYTYLGGGAPNRADHLPKIESRGRGQMTVEVTHGEEKQVIALPTEKLNRTKRYFVTFTVRGETQDVEKPESSYTPIRTKYSYDVRRNAKSV